MPTSNIDAVQPSARVWTSSALRLETSKMSTSFKYLERLRRLLLVEPDKPLWSILAVGLRGLAQVDTVADFQTARARLWRASLFKTPFDLLVTNMQLGAYSGLQLLYLLATTGLPTRSVCYTNHLDAASGEEAQRAGAFYEIRTRLPYALPAYLLAQLPAVDRRHVTIPERRMQPRGGRRCSDEPIANHRH
jgi:DNA-binding NtrC family response regulator